MTMTMMMTQRDRFWFERRLLSETSPTRRRDQEEDQEEDDEDEDEDEDDE